MSYLPPKHWWLKPFNWLFAKCQNEPLDYVYTHEIKCVDIRIYWDSKDICWRFAHGSISYNKNIDLCQLVDQLVEHGVKFIRLILERDGYEEVFITVCDYLKSYYPNITFLGGYRKSDWRQLYDFGTNNIPIHQWVGSMAEDVRWYERFIPRLYAKRMNDKNMENLKEGINLFDFI